MGMIAGIGSAIGGLSGLFGGGNTAQNVQLPQMWQLPNMTPAANQAFNTIGSLPGNFNTYNIPKAQELTNNIVNNPYTAGYQTNANVGSNLGTNAALGALGGGNYLANLGMSTVPGMAQSIWNTAADPQQALYARTAQQVQDQTRAANAAAGVATTPYGAGIEGQNMVNFNIDWQNNLLNRMATGAGAANSLYGTANNLVSTGENMALGAPAQFLSYGAVPWSTYNTTQTTPLNAMNSLGAYGTAASGLTQNQISDLLAYIGAGNQANSIANQTGQLGLNQANAVFGQNQAFGNSVGQGLQGVGNSLGWGQGNGNAISALAGLFA